MPDTHPTMVFVLSGPRYYTDVRETAKALGSLYGWTGARFGRLTVMFSDRPELDLTPIVQPEVQVIRDALKASGLKLHNPGLPSSWQWRGREDDEKAFNKLRAQVRDRLKGLIAHAVDEHLNSLTPQAEATLADLKLRLKDSIIAAVTAELEEEL